MRAQLHLLQESTNIDIDLPEAAPLAKMRAKLDVYSNIDHIRWTASVGNVTAETISTSPDTPNTLRVLASKLQHCVLQAAQATQC